MDPATVKVIIAAVQKAADALGIDLKKVLIGIGFIFVAEVLFLGMLPYLLFTSLFRTSPGGAPPGALWLWVPLVTTTADAAHIPPDLALAVVAHESGGNWQAENDDSNGTVDAGLMQINSANWATYGLAANPFSPTANVRAGVSILANALAANGGNVPAALETYNAGSAAAGALYDPQYAGDVARELAAIEAGPHLSATPLPVEGKTQAILITAWAPYGPAQHAYGETWPALVPPQTLALSAPQPVVQPLTPCGTAAKGVTGGVLPGSASCWVVVLSLGQTAAVTATWDHTVTVQGPHGTTKRVVPRTVTAQLEASRRAVG